MWLTLWGGCTRRYVQDLLDQGISLRNAVCADKRVASQSAPGRHVVPGGQVVAEKDDDGAVLGVAACDRETDDRHWTQHGAGLHQQAPTQFRHGGQGNGWP